MPRISGFAWLPWVGLVWGWTVAAGGADPPAAPPNVVLFLVDDMGWMDSTSYGSQYDEPPNMDRWARQSMRFFGAYATPLDSPTRASILTGNYSARRGVTSATGHLPSAPADAPKLPEGGPSGKRDVSPASQNFLAPAEITLAESLLAAGGRTGHFGKGHRGLTEPHWPERQGFQVAFHGQPDPGPPSYFWPYGFRRYQSFPAGPSGEYITDRLTDEALQSIAHAGLQPAGPVTAMLRSRGPGGSARIPWRTRDQEQLPEDGQAVVFSLPAGEIWAETRIKLPVRGELAHLRIYLPLQSEPTSLDSIQWSPLRGSSASWDVNALP